MSTPSAPQEIQVRRCSDLSEIEECVRVQDIVWGHEISVPVPMFVAVRHAGGQILGAFEGAKMVGFTQGLIGLRNLPARSGSAQQVGSPFIYSHMTAVLPEYRDRGVGRSLKLFQRQDALKRGIDLVEWTFDPLELKNAHFNLVKLGAIVRRFIPDCYGITGSPLHAGIPTDRLLAEWWLASERVKSILADDPPPSGGNAVRISLPADISDRKSKDRDAAIRIQSEAREQFQKWLSQGYSATSVENCGATVDYILEPADAIAGLHLPPLVPKGTE
ncbi:MAG: GNAT family N-acetyltransferase [Candidatus Acidiferrales bacterium]